MNWIKRHKFSLSIIPFATLVAYSFRLDVVTGDLSHITQIVIYYSILGYSVKWLITKVKQSRRARLEGGKQCQ